MAKWIRDLEIEDSEETRTCICRATHGSSISSYIQEAGYKITSRWYRTPRVLSKIFPGTSDRCWRCGREEGTLLHIFWGCVKIRSFWRIVREVCQNITGMNISLSPAFFLLHVSSIPWMTYKNSALIHLVNAARVCIPPTWKSPVPPSGCMWIQRVNILYRMEELVAIKEERIDAHREIWQQWVLFQSSLQYKILLSEGAEV